MKSIGNRLSQRYVSKGIIEPHFSNVYSYIFDYMFNFILYNLSLLILGFILKQHTAAIVYVIIVGSLRAVAGGYHCKTRASFLRISGVPFVAIFTTYPSSFKKLIISIMSFLSSGSPPNNSIYFLWFLLCLSFILCIAYIMPWYIL